MKIIINMKRRINFIKYLKNVKKILNNNDLCVKVNDTYFVISYYFNK